MQACMDELFRLLQATTKELGKKGLSERRESGVSVETSRLGVTIRVISRSEIQARVDEQSRLLQATTGELEKERASRRDEAVEAGEKPWILPSPPPTECPTRY